MAANRYGRIYHADHHYINLRFGSVDERRKFAEKFEKYHASHDHDGEVPRYENTAASVIGNMQANRVHDAHSVSIDGYATYEIEDYHNPTRWNTYNQSRYRPPTCCVPPLISVNRTFIDSSALTRHELSAIFMDMPDEDFQNLVKSVEAEGFKDPIIRMIDEQVLDGWHRYRAAKELNLLRKLRFQQWDEKDEGDPAAFVMARNIERRHLDPGQRAQIVVSFNERYGHGGDRIGSKSPNGDLKPKTREELAKEAGVGTRTIDRAVAVEKAGEEHAKKVISGEKTAGEIITAETVKSLWEQINPAISEWKKAREGVGHASKSMFIKATLRFTGLPADTETDVKVLKELLKLLTSDIAMLETLIKKQLDGESLWGNASLDEEQQASQTREKTKELKRKKQVAKDLWDKRIQAGRDYLGDGDTDLNQYLTLIDLEKGFIVSTTTYADDFKIALKLTLKPDFPLMWQAAAQYSLDDLEKYQRAMTMYAYDILQWERPDWSPATNWILPLIEAKKEKAAAKTEPDTEGLSAEFKRIFTLHSRFDRGLVDCETLSETYHIHVNDVESMMDDFQRELGSLEVAVRKQLESDAEMSVEDIAEQVKVDDIEVVQTILANIQIDDEQPDADADERSLEERKERLRSELETYWLQGYSWEGLDTSVFSMQYGILAETIFAMQKEIAEAHPKPPDMDALWDAFNKRFPKWKAKYAESGYKENDLVQNATESELFDALRSYRHSDRTGPVTAEEIQDVTDLMKRQSYPYSRHLRKLLRGDKPEQDLSEIDRCYVENQLRILESVVSPLLQRLGADDISHWDKERLTADLYDVFLEYENVPTEKEMIIALVDLVGSILAEEIPETLDNEVLCPDDEADRQDMNSDLVTPVE